MSIEMVIDPDGRPVRFTHMVLHGTTDDGDEYALGSLLTQSGGPIVLMPGDTLNINYKLTYPNDNQDHIRRSRGS